MGQSEVFSLGEGDRWFERNKGALEHFDPATDLPMRVIDLYGLRPRMVLEIGAANGARVAAIAERYGAKGVAVDVSPAAVADGMRRFPDLTFIVAPAHDVPLAEEFDLVVVSFVFHWIDRAALLRSAAEIDRLLRDGGILVVSDFCPSVRTKVPYHHLPPGQVFMYKQNYGALFAATGLYRLECVLTAEHATRQATLNVPEEERVAVWLLTKRLEGGYVPGAAEPGD